MRKVMQIRDRKIAHRRNAKQKSAARYLTWWRNGGFQQMQRQVEEERRRARMLHRSRQTDRDISELEVIFGAVAPVSRVRLG